MNTKQQLQKELQELKEALQMKLISVNDYSTMYLTISKKLEKLN